MEFYRVLEERYSCRNFSDGEIDDEKLNRIIKAAMDAPSAGNLQAYRILILRNQERKKQLASLCMDQDFIAQAPVVLIFCADGERSALKYGSQGKEMFALQDATIAASYAQLAITAEDLASVWVGAFDPNKLASFLQIPEIPVAVVPLGYATDQKDTRERREKQEIMQEI